MIRNWGVTSNANSTCKYSTLQLSHKNISHVWGYSDRQKYSYGKNVEIRIITFSILLDILKYHYVLYTDTYSKTDVHNLILIYFSYIYYSVSVYNILIIYNRTYLNMFDIIYWIYLIKLITYEILLFISTYEYFYLSL